MKYLSSTPFTLPAGGSKLSQREWEIRMGIRQPNGKKKPKRAKPATVCGLPVRVDSTMPPGVLELRDVDGKVLASVSNIEQGKQ